MSDTASGADAAPAGAVSEDVLVLAERAPGAVRAATVTGKPERYVGVDRDVLGGMTAIGRVVRDAQVFGLIEESETCAGWNFAGIDALLQKVNDAWDRHGMIPSRLPPALAERHARIHGAAVEAARAAGWSGERETEDDR